jgi:hypothetical protein
MAVRVFTYALSNMIHAMESMLHRCSTTSNWKMTVPLPISIRMMDRRGVKDTPRRIEVVFHSGKFVCHSSHPPFLHSSRKVKTRDGINTLARLLPSLQQSSPQAQHFTTQQKSHSRIRIVRGHSHVCLRIINKSIFNGQDRPLSSSLRL